MIITDPVQLGTRNWDILIPLTGLDDISFFTRIAIELQNSYKSIIFLTDREYIATNFPNEFYLLYLDPNRSNSLTEEELQQLSSHISETYDIKDLDTFSLTENAYSAMSLSKKYLRKKILYEFQQIEKVFSTISCEYVLSNVGAEILRRCLFRVAKKKDIQVIIFGPTPILKDSIFFTDDESMRWPHLELIPFSSMSSERISEVKNFIKAFREDKPFMFTSADQVRGDQPSSLFSFSYIVSRIKYLQKLKWKISKRTLIAIAWEKFTRVIKAKIILSVFSKNIDASKAILNSTENIVFFPLQMTAESRIGVRAPQFLDQSVAVELISKSLPAGFKLIVKEHPSWIGFLRLRTFYKIAKLKNVILMHPLINSHDIIRNSRFVTVINGTIGYEAILYGKPVITLASEYYVGYGLTIDVRDYSKVGDAIDRAIASHANEELLVSFVDGILKSLKPGIPWLDGHEETLIPTTAASINEFIQWCRANRHKITPVMEKNFDG